MALMARALLWLQVYILVVSAHEASGSVANQLDHLNLDRRGGGGTCSHAREIKPAARNPNCTTPTFDPISGLNQVQKAGCGCNPAKCDDPNCDGVTPNLAGKILPRLLCKHICPSPRCGLQIGEGHICRSIRTANNEGRCISDAVFGRQWNDLMKITYPRYQFNMAYKQSEVFGQQVTHALKASFACNEKKRRRAPRHEKGKSKYQSGSFAVNGVHRLLNSKDKPIGKVVWKAGLEVLDLDGLSVAIMFKRIVCFGTECYTYKIGQCYTCSDTRRGYQFWADRGKIGNTRGYKIQKLLKCPKKKLMLCGDSGSVSTQVPRFARHRFKTLSGKEVVKWRMFQFSGLIGAF